MSNILSSVGFAEGFLPLALAITSFLSAFNTVQCYVTTAYNHRIYNEVPVQAAGKDKTAQSEVTGLSCRTFGIWTALSGFIRMYAAFYLNDTHVYRLCFATYVCAWLHFVSEVVVFKTANLNGVVKGPLIVATTMGSWMLIQWGAYVQ